MKYTLHFLCIAAILVAIYLFLGFIATFYFTPEKIQELISSKSTLTVKMDKPQIQTKLDLSLLIKADKIEVLTPDDTFANLEKPILRIKIFPLIFKNLTVSKLEASALHLNLSRDKNGKFNFEKHLPKNLDFPFKLKFKNSDIHLKNTSIGFSDYKFSKKILINSNKLHVSDFGAHEAQNYLSDLSIALFDMKDTNRAQARFDVTFSANKNLLKIHNSTFSPTNANAQILGEINKYKTKKPELSLQINIADSDFMSFVNLVPPELVKYKTDIINELKIANPHARLKGELKIKGELKKPNVLGRLEFDDIYLFERPKNFKTAIAKCNFTGDKVNVDVFVPAPNNQYVKVKGVSELFGKLSGDYVISSSDSVDLAFAHKYLLPVQRVIGFKLGPLPCMKISGRGGIDLHTSGTIYDALVNGKFKGNNIVASIEGLNMVLWDTKVELDFKDKVVNIVNTNAKVDGGIFSISGSADDYNNMDILVQMKDISAKSALNIAKTSEIIRPYAGELSFVKSITSGLSDVNIYLKGKAQSLEGLDFLNDISPYGSVVLKNTSAVLIPDYTVKNIDGSINFSNKYEAKLNFSFKNSKNFLNAFVEPSSKNLTDKNTKFKFKLDLKSSNMLFSDLCEIAEPNSYFNNDKLKLVLQNPLTHALDFETDSIIGTSGTLPSKFKKSDLSKIAINAEFVPKNTSAAKNIVFKQGKYLVNNSKVRIINSKISLFDSLINTNGTIDNIFVSPVANLKIEADNIPVKNAEKLCNYTNIAFIKTLLGDFSDFRGFVSAKLDIRRNLPYGKIFFNNIGAYNKKQELPLELKSGGINFEGEKLYFDALNFVYGTTPVYFNFSLANYLSNKPDFNVFFTTNLDEPAFDKLVNPYLAYPVKVKGEVILRGRIRGGVNNYTLYSDLILPKETDIYYMGANFGDTDLERKFVSTINFSKNTAKVSLAKYLKFVPSQNNKPTEVAMLKAGGNVISDGKNLNFDNFRVVTQNPTSAKIFNLIFKKSVLKQGLFTCDLKFNGNVAMPGMLGHMNFQNINIPLYDTQISDMDFNISKDLINVVMKGKSFDSDVEISAIAQNKQGFPIVLNDLNVKSKKATLSSLVQMHFEAPKASRDIVPGQPIVFKPQDVVVLKGNLVADDVELYDIKAKNLKMRFSNPSGIMYNISDMEFDIADGKILTNGNFDVASLIFDVNSNVQDCDANILTESFLGLQNQIYGRTNAKINMKGKIPKSAGDIKSVTGDVNFSLNSGKMPKLGSLEYLLRAGNLIKSGLFGLTLNNLIEVLTPYKTGEFSTIKGSFSLADAKINSLEIFSKGNNLSLFIYGNYDILNDNADIEILGRLSKNVSNVLGAAGNASLNSLLNLVSGNKIKEGAKSQIVENINKIPLIELTSDDYRLFLAKIKGKLNSDDYVKSFNWLN